MKTELIEDPEQIEAVIKSCALCFVGLIDFDGSPLVLPMNFGFKDNTIYLHTAPKGSLVNLLEQNAMLCITFCSDPQLVYQHPDVACSYRMRAKSVICKGKASPIEEYDKKVEVLDLLMGQYVEEKSFNYSKPSVENVSIWQIPIQQVTGKAFATPYTGPKIIKGRL